MGTLDPKVHIYNQLDIEEWRFFPPLKNIILEIYRMHASSTQKYVSMYFFKSNKYK